MRICRDLGLFTLAAFAAFFSGACSSEGSSAPAATMEGSFAGKSFTPSSAAAFALLPSGEPNADALAIAIAEHGDLCSDVAASVSRPGGGLAIFLARVDAGASRGKPLPVGTYPLGALTAVGGFHIRAILQGHYDDATCSATLSTTEGTATKGSITLTSSSAAGVAGTFTATFPSGTLTGTFNTSLCASTIPNFLSCSP